MSKNIFLNCLPLLIIFIIYNSYESQTNAKISSNWEIRYNYVAINNYFDNALNNSRNDIVTPIN